MEAASEWTSTSLLNANRWITLFFCVLVIVNAERREVKTNELTIVIILQLPDPNLDLDRLKKDIETAEGDAKLKVVTVIYKEDNEIDGYTSICQQAKANGISLIFDLTWKGWQHAENVAASLGIPYLRGDITNKQFVKAADDYLNNRNATDAALIFTSETALDQALTYLIGNSIIRMLVLDNFNASVAQSLKSMRPMASNYVLYGSATAISQMFQTAFQNGLYTRDSKWTFVIENFYSIKFDYKVNGTVNQIFPEAEMCCELLSMRISRTSDCKCDVILVQNSFFSLIPIVLAKVFNRMVDDGKGTSVIADCNTPEENPSIATNASFYANLDKILQRDFRNVTLSDQTLKLRYSLKVTQTTKGKNLEANEKNEETMGVWKSEENFILDDRQANKSIERFLKVGIAEAIPFTFFTTDASGKSVPDGFCIRLLKRLAELMQFEFEFIPAPANSFGKKYPNGTWDGLIGDLVNGVTDIVVAALTMTSEREEAVDFVAPHFEQSGISIVMRKTEREVSLFKFMSVLEPEVWWCILAAIFVTAVVLWLLDKYSPFSGQNKKRYPYECRQFTLVECFWFALTSITPQGGGEPPKAISGRILVAAYWLFVVLMLATFTANLAAFLTVERMQNPVRSLEELAKQSKINYTVVSNTTIYDYFYNMAEAENELYRVWKDLTLNTSNDQSKYRVWDYPIKEQYNRILSVIKKTKMFSSAEEGFAAVEKDTASTFAFIHDAAEIKYAVLRSCNLIEIGEPFAEQPYAIAVQSGSYLAEEISKVLLDLQKDRYFEELYNIFWNASAKKNCDNSDETEGITLQSLGGVFIATLVGLAIGMLTLIGEVYYYKRKRSSPVQAFAESTDPGRKPLRRTYIDNVSNRPITVRARPQYGRY